MNFNFCELLFCLEIVWNLDDKVWNYIIENLSKVLLIFDGVDEFNVKEKIFNDDLGFFDFEGKEMFCYCFYKRIVFGKFFKGVIVIIILWVIVVLCFNMLIGVNVLEIFDFIFEDIEV